MQSGRFHLVALAGVVLLGLLLFLVPWRSDSKPPSTANKTRLAVLVVIDQFRGDFLSRWGDLFEEGGFKRLTQEGAWFQNCHYPYANTMTGPGHATLVAGCPPTTHGIVGNDWYEHSAVVNCVGLPRYEQVPPPLETRSRKQQGASPERLLAPTLADALKQATNDKARVVSLSLKDRSAVLPGGRKPNVCYWVDANGRFVTSTYYRSRPHPWVTDFNKSGTAEQWLGTRWTRLHPTLDYTRWSGPDDSPGEGLDADKKRTFPHPLGGPGQSKKAYHAALANSPFGNDLLLALVEKAIDREQLGTQETPDLLSISFSSNDLVGHTWGPDSQEVLDCTLRTDRIIKQLLTLLDTRVGRNNYTLVLSADHGICPLPEASRAAASSNRSESVWMGERSGMKDARRVPLTPILQAAEKHLDGLFARGRTGGTGTGRWIEQSVSNMLYLNKKYLASRGAQQSDVEAALARWLPTQPGIAAAYTRTDLVAGDFHRDPMARRVWMSFHPARSGDVMLVQKPFCLLTSTLTGTNHGTPHAYDTYVPLVVYGPGVEPGVRGDLVSPEAAAVILARALNIDPPADARVPVPDNLFAAP